MKIRLDRKMYAQAQRCADAQYMTFSRWVKRAIIHNYENTSKIGEIVFSVNRDDSISAFILLPNMDETCFEANKIRECIAIQIERETPKDWPWRYDRSSLEAVIQLETILGRTCDYHRAQDYIDNRIAQRREEIRVSEMKERKK